MPKHVSNVIELPPEEKVINAIPAYDFKSDKNLIITTKDGMIKRSKLKDFKLQRYNKATSCMKLKDNDEVISVIPEEYDTVFITTNTGYGLSFKTEEIPVVGVKASGVKAMKLKDDYIVSINNFSYQQHEYIGLQTDEITSIKLTEFPIADRYSTGSQIIKKEIISAYLIPTLTRVNKTQESLLDLEEPKIIQVVEEKEVPKKDKISLQEIDDQLMTIDDFLDKKED